MSTSHNPQEINNLQRSLSIIDSIGIIFGIMIGTGIFASPGSVLGSVNGSVGFSLIIWVLAGFLCLLGGLCFAELGSSIPKAGGSYKYLQRGLHPVFGFLFIWASIICLRTGGLAIVSIIFGTYLGSIIFSFETTDIEIQNDIRIKLLSMSAIVIIACVNVLSVKWSARLQNTLVIFKFIAIGFIFILAIIGLITNETTNIAKDNFTNIFEPQEEWSILSFFSSIGIATIYALWAYEGFSNLNAVAGEVINPGRNIPIAIIIAVLGVIITYFLTNISYLCVLSTNDVITSQAVAVDMAGVIAGTTGEIIMSLLVSLSAFGSLNGIMLTSARIFYASAVDKIFPFSSIVGRLSRFNSPYVAVIIESTVAIILVIPGNFESLVNYFGFIAWIFYALVIITLIRLRYIEKDLERPFKVRPFPIIPLIFICVSLFIVFTTILGSPLPSFIAFLILCIGIPLYYIFYWKGNVFINLYNYIKSKNHKTIIVEEDYEQLSS